MYNNEEGRIEEQCNRDDDDGDDDDDDENCVDVKSVLTACDRPILIRTTSYCDRSG